MFLKVVMIKVYIFIILSAITSVIAQICFKVVANRFENIGLHNHFYFFKQVLLKPLTWLGFLFIFLNLITWVVVLNFTELSFAFPFCSLNYIFILVSAKIILKERISLKRILGVLFIIVGMILVGFTHSH